MEEVYIYLIMHRSKGQNKPVNQQTAQPNPGNNHYNIKDFRG